MFWGRNFYAHLQVKKPKLRKAGQLVLGLSMAVTPWGSHPESGQHACKCLPTIPLHSHLLARKLGPKHSGKGERPGRGGGSQQCRFP